MKLFARLLLALAVLVALPSLSHAQKSKKLSLTPETQKCLLAFQEKYLTAPRALIIFTPDYCPALTREEVLKAANAAQNSAKKGNGLRRVILKKPQFACLIEKIKTHRAGLETDNEETPDAAAFELDCKPAG